MKTITTTIFEPYKKTPQRISVTGESRFRGFVGTLCVRYADEPVCSIAKATELQTLAVKTLLFLRAQPPEDFDNRQHIADLSLVSEALYEVATGGCCWLSQFGKTAEDERADFEHLLDVQQVYLNSHNQ